MHLTQAVKDGQKGTWPGAFTVVRAPSVNRIQRHDERIRLTQNVRHCELIRTLEGNGANPERSAEMTGTAPRSAVLRDGSPLVTVNSMCPSQLTAWSPAIVWGSMPDAGRRQPLRLPHIRSQSPVERDVPRFQLDAVSSRKRVGFEVESKLPGILGIRRLGDGDTEERDLELLESGE